MRLGIGFHLWAGKRWRLLAAQVLLAVSVTSASIVGPAQAVEAVPIGTFENPVHVAVAQGAPRLLFVVERPGVVQVMRDERKLDRPFLDISDIVRGLPDPRAGREEGLLSIAFPGDYPTTGCFYVFFVNNDGDLEIDEFRRSADNAARADPSTRRVVLVIPHRGKRNHNGGQLQFRGGLLYISTGDGGGNELPGERARKLDNLLGKILRINPREDGVQPYTVPSDNPFVGSRGRDEIFAYGLRNPWRFSFDGARLAIGDVGAMRREEVNFLLEEDVRRANFGWPKYEGELIFDADRPGPHPPTFPIFTYSHDAGGCAVIGGYVVRDPDIPALAGRYLYGDTCTGEVRSFVPNVRGQEAIDDAPTGIVLPGLTSFGKGFRGRLYLAQSSGSSGAVYRIAATPAASLPAPK